MTVSEFKEKYPEDYDRQLQKAEMDRANGFDTFQIVPCWTELINKAMEEENFPLAQLYQEHLERNLTIRANQIEKLKSEIAWQKENPRQDKSFELVCVGILPQHENDCGYTWKDLK